MSGHGPRIWWGLYPFSLLYGTGVAVRNRLFDWGVLPSREFPLPVICIGNLTVGGTGKTPHTEYLVRLLRHRFRIATLSRGYGRATKGFVVADGNATASKIGDEPYQMFRKFPDVTVAVDERRCEGIGRLMCAGKNIEVIVLDDAFQHRYVRPGLSIVLTDYRRPVYRDVLMPAGRLREPACGLRRADMVIVTKCPADMDTEERERIRRKLHLEPRQDLFFTTLAYGNLEPLFADTPPRSLSDIHEEEILLLTGIASPAMLIETLGTCCRKVTPLVYPDHHVFSADDMKRLETEFRQLSGTKRLIVTTEKDAARLVSHLALSEWLKPYIHTLPVEVRFLYNEEETFNSKIIEYVRKDSRNSSLHQG